ncbi:hypothetical protein [Janthinobacterium rivuli]|uniref:hypothetical protein n=1 Tax=Janthinobacterium rivuli TaxID=2751478 RepID=UPI003839F8DA
MKSKTYAELVLLVFLLTFVLTAIPVFFFVGWWKWLIAAVIFTGGVSLMIELMSRMESNP